MTAREIQDGESTELRLRRTIMAMSLIGIASMAVVTLFQTGCFAVFPIHLVAASIRTKSILRIPPINTACRTVPSPWPAMRPISCSRQSTAMNVRASAHGSARGVRQSGYGSDSGCEIALLRDTCCEEVLVRLLHRARAYAHRHIPTDVTRGGEGNPSPLIKTRYPTDRVL